MLELGGRDEQREQEVEIWAEESPEIESEQVDPQLHGPDPPKRRVTGKQHVPVSPKTKIRLLPWRVGYALCGRDLQQSVALRQGQGYKLGRVGHRSGHVVCSATRELQVHPGNDDHPWQELAYVVLNTSTFHCTVDVRGRVDWIQ